MPDWKAEILRRVAPLKLSPTREAEIVDELSQHLEDRYQELLASGQSEDAAFRAVLDELKGEDLLARGLKRVEKNFYREPIVPGKAGRNIFESILYDVRYALRMLRKSPGFTAVAILTLALGIGVNTAVFSIFDWATLRTPPVSKPEQVATLAAQDIRSGWDNGFSYPDLVDIRNESTAVFSDVAGTMIFAQDGLSGDGMNTPIWTNYVTTNFFRTIGVKPASGNLIEPVRGKSVDDEPVLVLSYDFWKAHFGGDLAVIGKSALINGHPVTIIGVAPKGFTGITSLIETQGYLPLGMAAVTSDASKDFLTNRKASDLQIITRLKLGIALASAQPLLKVIGQRLSTRYPTTDTWRTLRAFAYGPMGPVSDPQSETVVSLISALFLTLAALVLILACLNVANMLLARASGRQREMAVRAAVGAARNRLIRQLLTESLLLALLGCAAGIALGLAASRYLGSVNIHMDVPLILDFQFDWRVFTYAFGAALVTALLVGVAPALRATRGDLNSLLHESPRTATVGSLRARSVLVVAQVAGSLMLLVIAGLFVRSLRNVEHANLGFDPNDVVNFTVDPHETGYNKTQGWEFLKNLLSRVRTLPGAEAASLAETVPMGGIHLGADLNIDGYSSRPGRSPHPGYNVVSPRYFETMHIPVVRGRGFLDSDNQTSQYVAVINEAMAKDYWHGEDPIGRRFTTTNDPKNPIEVVGEVKNSRTAHLFGTYKPYFYFPLAQHYDYSQPVTVQLRTSLPLAAINREVVATIGSLAPTMPVFDIQTMTAALDTMNGLLLFQIGAGLAGSLGILGLVLAMIGVYGVVSYSASQRTHEIGIRMALGAQPADVLRMILWRAFFVVGAGLIAGILAATAIARLAGNLLPGVSPVDPFTYVSASILLTGVALVACYIPARRAMRVDPMFALRYE